MLVTREMLALVGAASKDQYRPAMAGIRLEAPGFAVATDGHMLAALADTSAGPSRLEELPALPAELADCDLPTTIPTEACKQAAALIRKAPRHLPLTQVARLVTDGTGQLSLAVLNGDIRWQLVPFTQPDSMYPDWTRVWQSLGKPVKLDAITLAPGLLDRAAELVCATLDLNPKRSDLALSMAWTFYGSDKPAEFQAQDHARTLRGILMPMRASETPAQTGTPVAPTFAPVKVEVAA